MRTTVTGGAFISRFAAFFVTSHSETDEMKMPSPKKVSFHTLGCKLNFSETSTIARQFEEGGYATVRHAAEADICVVNTCAVTEHAEKKCRNLIRRLHREAPQAIIAVTGCYAQLRPEELAAIEGVDLVLGNRDKGTLFDRVAALGGKSGARIYSCDTAELTNFFAAFSTGERTRAFLKVQDGCDYKCSYCTIHYARGASRNMPVADLVQEAERIAASGRKEIVITGINTGDFGRTTGERFADLLTALDRVAGIERYRISSIEPNLLTDDIIGFCAASAKFHPHCHSPRQSGSDRILGLMRRRYRAETFRNRIETVRSSMPDAFIGVDVIVGFPGETDEDFRQTYDLLESLAPAYLHVFPFSERPGTPAADMPGRVRDDLKTLRAERLGALCSTLHRRFCEAYEGRSAEVLFEGRGSGGMMYGYTGNYIRCKAPYDRTRVNELCSVRLGRPDADGTVPVSLPER